jgi:hypothetical protein
MAGKKSDPGLTIILVDGNITLARREAEADIQVPVSRERI